MKSRFLRALTASLLIVFAGCDNELDITDDWRETPVVYSLLNPNTSQNYIRLQRAYLGEGNAYLMGQYSDSLYFDTNRVSVRVIRVKTTGAFDTVYCPVTTDIRKDEGVFADAPHFLYEYTGRLFSDSRYQLLVNRHIPVGSKTVTTLENGIFDPSGSNRQFIMLVKNSELQEASLKEGNLLHSLGFVASGVLPNANYSVSVSATPVNGCLNPSALPSFTTVLNSEVMLLNNGWNDIFFKTTFAVPSGSDIAFRICINPQNGAGAAALSFTETPGCVTFAASATCGSGTAAISDTKRPVIRLGYSGNGVDNRITFAETELVANFSSPTLSTITSINLANSEPYRIKCVSSKNAALQGLEARFRYLERKINTPNFVEKSVIYPLGTVTPSTTHGGELFEFLMSGDAFFQYLASQIPNDPTVTRPANAVKIDFIAKIGTLGFYTYYVVNQPGNSVYNQPEYTNIENGKGIFTCRLDSTRSNYQLNSPSTDSLNFGRFTGNLFN